MILLLALTNQFFIYLMIPLSLYIHIPWCIRKCPYCDFNSHKSPDKLPEEEYVQALIEDLKTDLESFKAGPIRSIFIGGGTPSLFSAKAYERLFNELQQLLHFSPGLEITLEANPGTVESQRFKDYRSLGINRLSLGIQSFNAKFLQSLGRIHDDLQAKNAIQTAREAGFDNINLDLMHGLPGQSLQEGLEDLHCALSFEPEHLSWYQLTIEPNTLFYKQKPSLPSEDEASELEEQGFALLKSQGYERYEISAFSKADKQSRHNMNYWLFADYLGIGAGAHGKLSNTEQKLVSRTNKQRQPKDYLNRDKAFLAAKTILSKADRIFEFMLNACRLEQAIPKSLFSQRCFLEEGILETKLLEAEQKGLIEIQADYWQVTSLGRRFTNDLQAVFLE